LVHVAKLAGLVLRATDEEDGLHGLSCCTADGQLLECVDRRCRACICVRTNLGPSTTAKQRTLGIADERILLAGTCLDSVVDLCKDLHIVSLEQIGSTTTPWYGTHIGSTGLRLLVRASRVHGVILDAIGHS
jgi:hypothetical protein